MKTLKNKSEITAKNLRNDCDYKGHRLGKDKNLYTLGTHFSSTVDYFETIADLKACF